MSCYRLGINKPQKLQSGSHEVSLTLWRVLLQQLCQVLTVKTKATTKETLTLPATSKTKIITFELHQYSILLNKACPQDRETIPTNWVLHQSLPDLREGKTKLSTLCCS